MFCRSKGKGTPAARVGLLSQHDEYNDVVGADSIKSSKRDLEKRSKKKKRSSDSSSRDSKQSSDHPSTSATAASAPQTVSGVAGDDGGDRVASAKMTPSGSGGRWVHVPN